MQFQFIHLTIISHRRFYLHRNNSIKKTVLQTVHVISCNWLPFYRPCSFASQTFIWFADFLIIALILMQKNWFYYTLMLQYTQENITVLTTKIKKEQPIHILELFFYFRRPRSIDITVSCSFVLRLFHILKTSFCFSVRFSELPS